MADRLVYEDTDKRIWITAEATGDTPQQERYEWTSQHDQRLTQAIATLRQWADDAEATTATQGNAVQVLNVVVDRLGVFFDRFADLLEQQYGE